MKATVTLEFDSIEEMRAYFAAPAGGVGTVDLPLAPPPAPDENAAVKTETRGRPAGVKDSKPRKPRGASVPPVEQVQSVPPLVEPAAAGTVTTTPTFVPTPATPAVAEPQPTKDDLQAAISDVFQAKGLEVALAVLSRFGAKSTKEVKPELYGQAIAHAKSVLNGAAV